MIRQVEFLVNEGTPITPKLAEALRNPEADHLADAVGAFDRAVNTLKGPDDAERPLDGFRTAGIEAQKSIWLTGVLAGVYEHTGQNEAAVKALIENIKLRELEGDILMAKGNRTKAATAYRMAVLTADKALGLSSTPEEAQQILAQKIILLAKWDNPRTSRDFERVKNNLQDDAKELGPQQAMVISSLEPAALLITMRLRFVPALVRYLNESEMEELALYIISTYKNLPNEDITTDKVIIEELLAIVKKTAGKKSGVRKPNPFMRALLAMGWLPPTRVDHKVIEKTK